MSTLYQRRIEQEWALLQVLLNTNPGILKSLQRTSEARGEVFSFTLQQTQGVIGQKDHLEYSDAHAVTLYFPRFFPSTPIEASLTHPIFHPNVHPETGFVCLWNRFSPGDTVMEAISQIQQVITWKLVNQETDHLMQPDALTWYKNPARGMELPLAYQPITKPASFQQEKTYAVRPTAYRKRLE